ncbi:ABC transporter permease [Rhodopirellula sp. JC740]|uniref:ABC transporter permease n=1 Tax=Rhodopirellula halodulae TaxID=2894198 RepID=A0ABS8NHK0_9BACT|nr:ABC transporter permease [Rhodopirellula sp. JC740]MCC9643015.1 ABC transporter permease [Rhodopirellula sp. JC740]
MVWKVIEIHLRRLRHNRVEWLLTFVVPIAFFSIFALIFSRGVGGTPRVKVALIRDAATANSADEGATSTTSLQCDEVIQTLRESDGLRLVRDSEEDPRLDRAAGEDLVRRGSATIAIVLREDGEQLTAELLNDASDQVASQVVSALVMRAMMMARASTAIPSGPNERPVPAQAEIDSEGPPADSVQQANFQEFARNVAQENSATTSDASSDIATETGLSPPSVNVVNVIGENKSNPVISVYAAGIAVMFLLFGATSGGGVLLEERENQTLERLLSTQMTMDHLLLGKWFYLTLLGCIQVTVMFVWAQLVFGLDLLGNLDGFVMMTVVTSAAAASFGLFLATLCKTRGQLNGLSVVAVLTMSALGGSMVPRYVMSEGLREAGLWTFNAWALDGYDKVFWRELPPSALQPQLTVLLGTAFGLLILARLLAIRWETS